MTREQLAELLNEAGIKVDSWDIEDDGWTVDNVESLSVHLDYDSFSNLITMHRAVTALLAAGCISCRVEERECGSGDEVSHWRVLVMEFPC